jgi:hypothetical protein
MDSQHSCPGLCCMDSEKSLNLHPTLHFLGSPEC